MVPSFIKFESRKVNKNFEVTMDSLSTNVHKSILILYQIVLKHWVPMSSILVPFIPAPGFNTSIQADFGKNSICKPFQSSNYFLQHCTCQHVILHKNQIHCLVVNIKTQMHESDLKRSYSKTSSLRELNINTPLTGEKSTKPNLARNELSHQHLKPKKKKEAEK